MVHERPVRGSDDGVEWNPGNQLSVVTGTGFHRAGLTALN
jgi:hypothetical protein